MVELVDSLMADCDQGIVGVLEKRIRRRYAAIHLETRVARIETRAHDLLVAFDGPGAPATASFDAVLIAVGRLPDGGAIGAEHAGVSVDPAGFIPVDEQMRTNVAPIYAVSDIAGKPMLAHKASHEGKVAAEVIAGLKSRFDARAVPSVAYTDPEVAWVGLTETQATASGIDYGKGLFPWAASGRALALARGEGLTKLLFEGKSGRLLGMAAVGPSAGDLIAEGALAIEMGCDAQNLALTIHPHPTLSETIGLAAEALRGDHHRSLSQTEPLEELERRVNDLFQRALEMAGLFNLDANRDRAIRTNGQNPQILGLPRTDQASMTSEDLPFADLSTQAAQSVAHSRLPLTDLVQRAHAQLADLDTMVDKLREEAERIRLIVRPPYGWLGQLAAQPDTIPLPTHRDPRVARDTLYDMRMPPYVRDSDATALSLTHRQYDELMSLVEKLEQVKQVVNERMRMAAVAEPAGRPIHPDTPVRRRVAEFIRTQAATEQVKVTGGAHE